jgi:hypothetical protein
VRFSSRQDLIEWVRDHAPTPSLRHALDRAEVTVWGLFEGGFIVEVGKFILGIRPHREKMGEWVCGFLTSIPWKSYMGGDTPLTGGDHPAEAATRKSSSPAKRA